MREERREFTRHIWNIWNPRWPVTEMEFAATARSFDNPDWAYVVLHSYRARWGLAPLDPAYASQEERLKADPVIRVPTLVLHGGGDPCNDPATSEGKERFFAASYNRVVIPDVGHFPQREAARNVADHLVRFLKEVA